MLALPLRASSRTVLRSARRGGLGPSARSRPTRDSPRHPESRSGCDAGSDGLVGSLGDQEHSAVVSDRRGRCVVASVPSLGPPVSCPEGDRDRHTVLLVARATDADRYPTQVRRPLPTARRTTVGSDQRLAVVAPTDRERWHAPWTDFAAMDERAESSARRCASDASVASTPVSRASNSIGRGSKREAGLRRRRADELSQFDVDSCRRVDLNRQRRRAACRRRRRR